MASILADMEGPFFVLPISDYVTIGLPCACFTGLAVYSTICLDSSKVVILWENGVVNGVPDEWQDGVLDVSDFRF